MATIDPFGLDGQVLDGQFRVDRFIGEGGFSIVYRGTHVGLSEPIAIKCLKLPTALGSALVESFIKRFRDESRLHYKLSQGHLHIARSIASGTTVSPATSALVPYTVLEWLDGESLAQDLDHRREQGLGGRPMGETVKLLDSAIDALAYAHAQGVVHRDFTPSNLFLAKTPAGPKLKILDFGVAKIMSDSWLAMGAAKTVGNVRMFTPAFAAPEQLDERVGSIGPWTDVYAVALVVLEVLTGRTAMDSEHLGEIAARALNRSARPTPRAMGVEVGDEVEAAMARAVQVSPGDRPRDSGEFWGMLKHAIGADAAAGRPATTGSNVRWSSVPPTVRMADPPAAPRVASGGVDLLRPAGNAAQAFGGTLRMANAPGSDPPRRATTAPPPAPLAARAPESPPPPSWSIDPPPPPKSRGWYVALVVVGVLLLMGAGAAWMLR